MGILLSCCGGGSSSDYDNMGSADDPETRRRKLAEAAESRMKVHEGRGLKNPEALKLRQKRIEELERKHQEEAGQPGGGLRWQVN